LLLVLDHVGCTLPVHYPRAHVGCTLFTHLVGYVTVARYPVTVVGLLVTVVYVRLPLTLVTPRLRLRFTPLCGYLLLVDLRCGYGYVYILVLRFIAFVVVSVTVYVYLFTLPRWITLPGYVTDVVVVVCLRWITLLGWLLRLLRYTLDYVYVYLRLHTFLRLFTTSHTLRLPHVYVDLRLPVIYHGYLFTLRYVTVVRLRLRLLVGLRLLLPTFVRLPVRTFTLYVPVYYVGCYTHVYVLRYVPVTFGGCSGLPRLPLALFPVTRFTLVTRYMVTFTFCFVRLHITFYTSVAFAVTLLRYVTDVAVVFIWTRCWLRLLFGC